MSNISALAQIERVIGARGIDPRNRNLKDFELIDRLDGQGIQIRFWDEIALGGLPTPTESTLATTPRLSLSSAINTAETGVIVTCQLDDTSASTVNWRCVDPDGVVHTANAPAVNGQESWEILTGKPGLYRVSAWSSVYGYAELSIEGV
jgi:hypothetical protein